MEAPPSNTDTSPAIIRSSSRPQPKRVRRFHALLNEQTFVDFVRPVTLGQVERAIEFLDQNFGRWEKHTLTAAADYVLPAIHKLFPEQRRFGFSAPFGPKQAAREGFGQWLNRHIFFDGMNLVGTRRWESPEAR